MNVIETKRLRVRLMDICDEQDIVRWRNQKEIIDKLFSHKGIILSKHREWFERYLKDQSRIEFMMIKKEDNKSIGTIGLSNIDLKNQKAEYGILIGEKQERRRGYAAESSYALIKYAFNELNLQKIYLRVIFDNINAINLYNKIGFKKEGLFRKEIYKNGKFKDVVIMSILRDEWMESSE